MQTAWVSDKQKTDQMCERYAYLVTVKESEEGMEVMYRFETPGGVICRTEFEPYVFDD